MKTITQLTREDLAGMKAKDIETARVGGQLAEIMGQPVGLDLTDDGQLSRADVQALHDAGRHEDVANALLSGRLSDLLGGVNQSTSSVS